MKLRDKKTGEIRRICCYREGNFTEQYKSLAELNEKFEDYKEPKEYYFIYENGSIGHINWNGSEQDILRKSIGNHFETKEEAEQAIKWLTAIQVLKANGFRFIDWEFDDKTVADGKIWFDVGVNTEWNCEQLLEKKSVIREILDMLFGGGE